MGLEFDISVDVPRELVDAEEFDTAKVVDENAKELSVWDDVIKEVV